MTAGETAFIQPQHKATVKTYISANYLERKSEYKWLVRTEGQTARQATQCIAVECEDVVFEANYDEGMGFGCAIHAVTEQPLLMPGVRPDDAVPLRFAHGSFRDPDGEVVTQAKRLALTSSGRIFATL